MRGATAAAAASVWRGAPPSSAGRLSQVKSKAKLLALQAKNPGGPRSARI